MDASEIKVGDRVVIIDARLNSGAPSDVPVAINNPRAPFGKEGIVVALQDPEKHPGKLVALCMREPVSFGHTCDGLVPSGRGVWSRPEHLYRPEDHIVHAEASHAWIDQQERARAIYEAYGIRADRESMTIGPEDVGELKL